jgi:hypothetical protein
MIMNAPERTVSANPTISQEMERDQDNINTRLTDILRRINRYNDRITTGNAKNSGLVSTHKMEKDAPVPQDPSFVPRMKKKYEETHKLIDAIHEELNNTENF